MSGEGIEKSQIGQPANFAVKLMDDEGNTLQNDTTDSIKIFIKKLNLLNTIYLKL